MSFSARLAQPWFTQAFSAEASFRRGRARQALRILEIAGRAPGAPAWLALLRFRIKKLAGLPGAAREVDAAFRRDPGCAWVFSMAPLPARAGAAERRLRRLLTPFSRRPECAAVYAYRGQARLFRGLRRAGLIDLRRAVRLEPGDLTCSWLGEALRQEGRLDEAVLLLSEALRHNPRFAGAYCWRARAYLQRGEAGRAAQDLDRALRLRPDARAYLDRSRLRRGEGDLSGAVDDMEAALRLNPELSWDVPTPEGLRRTLRDMRVGVRRYPREGRFEAWRGDALLRLGRAREALAALDQAVHKSPRHALSRAWRAYARLQTARDTRGVLSDLRAAFRLDPRCAPAFWVLAETRFVSGDAAGAIEALERALKLNRFSARLYLARAKAQAALGRRQRALKDAEKALRLSPHYPEAEALRAALTAEGPYPKIPRR